MLVGDAKTNVSELTGVKECKTKNPIKTPTPSITLTEIMFLRDILEDCFLDLFNDTNYDFTYIINN